MSVTAATDFLLPSTILVGLLILAAASDIRSRRVPNLLSLSLLVTGVAVSIFLRGTSEGVIAALAGLVTGLALWLPFYAARLIGAGDVKLFAAGAAWLGWQHALVAALVTSIVGGVLGFAWLVRSKGSAAAGFALVSAVRSPRLLQLQPVDRRERVPYALAIGSGILVAWIRVVLTDGLPGAR